jgi:hypothetical protein
VADRNALLNQRNRIDQSKHKTVDNRQRLLDQCKPKSNNQNKAIVEPHTDNQALPVVLINLEKENLVVPVFALQSRTQTSKQPEKL